MLRSQARRRRTFAILTSACTSAILGGCGEDNPVASNPKPGTVVLQAQHNVGADPLVLHDMRYVNAAGQTYGVDKLEYYLSDVRLRRSDGVVYGLDAAFYHDAEEPATLQHRLEGVLPGTYTHITVTWGLTAEKNVPGALPDNTQNNNMFWPPPLGGGYHYSKCEGFYMNPGGSPAGYATHMGRVRRDVDTRDHHYFFSVTLELPSPIHVDNNTWNIPIVMDINQWYESPNIYDFPSVPMIMDNLDRQRMLMENGASAFSIGTLTTP